MALNPLRIQSSVRFRSLGWVAASGRLASALFPGGRFASLSGALRKHRSPDRPLFFWADSSNGTKNYAKLEKSINSTNLRMTACIRDSNRSHQVHLRRKRFAFAVAPRWKGASIDAAEAPLRSANPDKERACCFSSTILANSVGEHLPCASIQLLRAIVSNEENINSVIIAGSRTAFRRLVFFIKRDWSIRILFASQGRPNSRVTSRHFDHSSASRAFMSRSNRPYGATQGELR